MIDSNSIDYSQFDAIIFDLDGTLYRKPRMALWMIGGELLHLRKLASERRTRKRMQAMHFASEEAFYKAFFEHMADGQCFTAAAAEDWYQHHYMPLMVEVIRRHYHLEPWAVEVMKRAKVAGLRVAVYSDYGFVREKLSALELDTSLLDLMVCGPELGGLKPCKESMLEVLKRLSVVPQRSLMIGDREDTDGESAKRVGAQFLCCK